MERIVMYSDGGSRGNPGPSSLGVYIETLDKRYGEFLGTHTNNFAEYAAIVSGMKKVKALLGKDRAKKAHLDCYMDSELACRQLNHEYRIKDADIQKMFIEIWNEMLDFGKVTFTHVMREKNTVADAEANKAMDEAAGQGRQKSLL